MFLMRTWKQVFLSTAVQILVTGVAPPRPPSGGSRVFPLCRAMSTLMLGGEGLRKRFYEKAGVLESKDGRGWQVHLDGKAIKTPAKNPLFLPSPDLAHAIAVEWQFQDAQHIRPFTMPIFSMAATVTDVYPLPNHRVRVIDALVSFLPSDAACCRHETEDYEGDHSGVQNDKDADDHADPVRASLLFASSSREENSQTNKLRHIQDSAFDPLIRHINSRLGVEMVASTNLWGAEHRGDAVQGVRGFLQGLSDWELGLMEELCRATKSMVISFAFFTDAIDCDEAIRLTRLEEEYQIQKWGMVEGGHDIDRCNLEARLAAAAVIKGLIRRMTVSGPA